jgi:hypothetical protein
VIGDLSTNATFPAAGLVRFHYLTVPQSGVTPSRAHFTFCIDATCPLDVVFGGGTWQEAIFSVSAGPHSFRWRGSVPPGGTSEETGGSVWVDAVSFEAGGNVYAENAVGIGVSDPSNILTVKQNSLTDPIADQWTTYSSRRWKTDVRTIGSALGLLERLRGVRFRWKTTGKRDLGLIAEEVDRVLPGIVAHDESGRASGLDYARLVPVLIEGVKEQQLMLERQRLAIRKIRSEGRSELRALRRRYEALVVRLARLERLARN